MTGKINDKLYEDNESLIKKARNGDLKARDKVIVNNLGLVYSIVRRFLNRGYEEEDLVQIGSIGLIRAAEKFDLSFNVKFSTYAVPMIIGEIKRFLRDDGIIKVSRSLKETAANAAVVKKEIEKAKGTEATVKEIADKMGISAEELSNALESQRPMFSIYAKIDDGNGEGKPLIEKLESVENPMDKAVDKLTIQCLMEELEPRDKEIVKQRYFDGKTQIQIAEKMGISQVQVSRLEKKILQKMRNKVWSP